MRSRPVSRGQPCLQPCIAELLRTCVYPPTLLLRVERILEENTVESRRDDRPSSKEDTAHGGTGDFANSTYRLYLGDGENMIQAVLAPHLHPLIYLQETTEGSLIELRDYKIRRAKRLRCKGDIIYLGVEDYVCISLSRPTTREAHNDVLVSGGGFVVEEEGRISISKVPKRQTQARSSPSGQDTPHYIPSSQESEAYETVRIDPEMVEKRRQALHKMSSNNRQKRRHEMDDESTPIKRPRPYSEELSLIQEADRFETVEIELETNMKRQLALQELSSKARQRREPNKSEDRTPTKRSRPEARSSILAERDEPLISSRAQPALSGAISDPSAPLHTLDSLLHPPSLLPTRNYPVTIFAVISWISPTLVHRPGSPFPPKRTLKLHDPSISSRQVGVSISVFIDAASFAPRHSTIALFRGVIMQMYRDEVILNAYPTLKDRDWYIDDEEQLKSIGYDVQGMRDWWEERKKTAASSTSGGKGNGVTKTGGAGRFPEHAGGILTRE